MRTPGAALALLRRARVARARARQLARFGTSLSLTQSAGVTPPPETSARTIEEAFKEFTSRDDIAVVLINQYVRAVCGAGPALRCCALSHTRPSHKNRLQTWSATSWTRTRRCERRACLPGSAPGAERRCLRTPQPVPAVLEIPSKDRPYDPAKVRSSFDGNCFASHADGAAAACVGLHP